MGCIYTISLEGNTFTRPASRSFLHPFVLAITITGLLACSPKAVEEIITEAETLTARGDFREAVLEYKSAISMQPSDSDLRRKVADLYMILGDYATAEKEYSKAFSGLHHSLVSVIVTCILQTNGRAS